jgi:hypothetical protein
MMKQKPSQCCPFIKPNMAIAQMRMHPPAKTATATARNTLQALGAVPVLNPTSYSRKGRMLHPTLRIKSNSVSAVTKMEREPTGPEARTNQKISLARLVTPCTCNRIRF